MTTNFGIDADYVYDSTGKSITTKLSEYDDKILDIVDKNYVDDGLSKKANAIDTYTKTEVNAAISPKSDKSYVDTQLATKASTSYVDQQVATIASGGTIDLSSKADKSYVDNQLTTKANQSDFTTLSNTVTSNTKHIQNGWLDVKVDFGAMGDGVTDDTTSIQNALNYARDNGSARLYFPEGTYLYTSNSTSTYLRLYKNTTIRGAGKEKTTIKRVGIGYKVFMNGEKGNTTYATLYNGDGNIHFEDIGIDLNSGNGVDTSLTMSAFDLGHGENISFTRFKCVNGQVGHYFQVTGCKNVRFKECYLGEVNSENASAYITSELIQIEAISSSSFPSFGSGDITISRDVIIENCIFKNVIRALGTHGAGDYGTGSIVYCENIIVKDCTFDGSVDNMINLTGFRYSHFDNNLIINCNSYGILLAYTDDSRFNDNVILSPLKSAVYIGTSSNNKFSKNLYKDVAQRSSSSYSAIRLSASYRNTFDDDRVYSSSPAYTYAWYSSDGCVDNQILSHQFTSGTSGRIGGADDTEMANYIMGNGQDIIFDGDLSSVGSTGTLTHDIRNYSMLIISGNDNSSTTAGMTTFTIPKVMYLIGTTGFRFRLIVDDSSSSDRLEFSFPTSKSIKIDTLNGSVHLRRIIGII